MKTKRIGIVGCGSIARHHLQGYEINGGSIMGLTDLDSESAGKMALDYPNASVFASHQEMIDSGKVDVISICTPPAFHEEAAVYALRRGIHVLCEKPFTHALDSAMRLAAVSRESEALLMCGFRHRFLPALQRIHSLLPELGSLVLFHNTFGGPLSHLKDRWFARPEISGGGAMIDTSSHSIDLFRFLVGEVSSAFGAKARRISGIEVEDTGVLTLRAESGCLGTICATWVAGVGVALLDIIGEKGRLTYDYTRPAEIRLRLETEPDWRIVATEAGNGFGEMIEHFFGAIDGKWELICGARDGLRTLEVLQEADALQREKV